MSPCSNCAKRAERAVSIVFVPGLSSVKLTAGPNDSLNVLFSPAGFVAIKASQLKLHHFRLTLFAFLAKLLLPKPSKGTQNVPTITNGPPVAPVVTGN